MTLFKPLEVEIKTGWTRQELIQRLSKKALVTGNRFEITTGVMGYNAFTYVEGTIETLENWTTIAFRIYPSMFLRAFTLIWLGLVGLVMTYSIVEVLTTWDYDNIVHESFLFWLGGLFVSKLSFKSSADSREGSIRQLVKV